MWVCLEDAMSNSNKRRELDMEGDNKLLAIPYVLIPAENYQSILLIDFPSVTSFSIYA